MVHYVGDNSANTYFGTVFKDTLEGRGGDDLLNGMEGNDSILGGAGVDQLHGADGKDTIRGGLDQDFIQGGEDLDIDQLFGDEGNDVITARRKDIADGGDGSDYVAFYLSDLPGGNYDLSGWTSGGAFTIAGTSVTGFESGFIQFGEGDQKVRAPAFLMAVYGGDGADTLLGGAGSDYMSGGTASVGDADVVKGGDSNDNLFGGVGDFLDGGGGVFDNFELYLGGTTFDYDIDFADLFAGQTVFFGDGTRVVRLERGAVQFGVGDDLVKNGSTVTNDGIRLTDNGGNDTFIGGDGDDNLSVGQGNDVLRGGGGLRDIANYQYETADLVIDLNLTVRQDTGGAGMDLILGCEHAYGGQGDDRITGDNNANSFEGYGGADTLIGGQGDDTLNGGTGGFDPATDIDRLIGGAGKDTYDGGVGDDVLVWASTFHTTVAAPDQIESLAAGDILDLGGIDANTTVGGDQAFTIVGALTGVAGQLAVVFASGKTQWLMDTNGDAAADGMFEASGDHTVHADYVL
jgi:Ca2+-binding RTX toxin-like protein